MQLLISATREAAADTGRQNSGSARTEMARKQDAQSPQWEYAMSRAVDGGIRQRPFEPDGLITVGTGTSLLMW